MLLIAVVSSYRAPYFTAAELFTYFVQNSVLHTTVIYHHYLWTRFSFLIPTSLYLFKCMKVPYTIQ